jgi:Plant transposon protein
MGNSLSTQSFIPSSLSECIDRDGQLDMSLYYLYVRHKRRMDDEDELDDVLVQCMLSADEQNFSKKKHRPKKGKRNIINLIKNSDGTTHPVESRDSCWFTTYVTNPMVGDVKFNNKFRRRFCCSFQSYSKLLEMVSAEPIFHRWLNSDAFGKKSSPIEILLLSCLRYLGRGWTFDDLEESTSIGEETQRQFFHVFIYWGSTSLYNKYVIYPKSNVDCLQSTKVMKSAGFHGCVGSTDATHITMMRCPVSRANEHRGPKECLPARTYNITVNHRRQILHTTKGHPSRWNDKTLAHFDEFIKNIKEEKILNDFQFSLMERSVDGGIIHTDYNGCWLMCDNGYQKWSCLMSPIKDSFSFKEKRWSEWLESMRKDVECTFGILKGRFSILRTGIRLHKIDSVDQLWCTCCALHNMFLDDDGLNVNWEQGVQSDWQGELGRREYDVELDDTTNNNTYTANDNNDNNNADAEADAEAGAHLNCQNNQRIQVSKCSHNFFQRKLIEHFDILFEKDMVKWPTRSGLVQFSFQ